MVDFSRVIEVHDRRLASAKKTETEARIALQYAEKKLQEAKEKKRRFLEETQTQEFDLLTALLNTSVTVNDLLRVEEELKKTQKQIEKLIEAIHQPQDEVNASLEHSKIAISNRQKIDAKLMKSREFYKKIQKEKAYAAMITEERDFDEFSTIMFGRNGE